MKTKHQLIIDNYIFKPIAFLMNFLVRIVGKILRLDHDLSKDFKKIVICKFKGMGSIIQSTPMIEALRKKFPEAEIIFVTSIENKSIIEKVKFIDTVICLNDKNVFILLLTTISSLFKLIAKRPSVFIDLEIYSNFSTLFTAFTLSKNRIGFYLRSSSFNMGIYTHMMFFNKSVPISEVYLQIARLFGSKHSSNKLYPLYESVAVYKNTPKENYVIINPNASDLRLERRWDIKNFQEIIKNIISHYPEIEILIIGSKSEREYSSKAIEGINNEKVKNIAGLTNIDELIYLIRHATLMITNDTGPMHIAFACETPSVCLFGPCSPDQYYKNDNVTIIYKNVFCSPCVHDFSVAPCNGDNVCMKLISQKEVFSKIQAQIDNNQAENFQKGPVIYANEVNEKILGIVNRTL